MPWNILLNTRISTCFEFDMTQSHICALVSEQVTVHRRAMRGGLRPCWQVVGPTQ